MFKVEDKVRIKSKSVGADFEFYRGANNNKLEGIITGISGDGSGKDRENCIEIYGGCFAPQDLELIQDDWWLSLKVGDKVKLRKDSQYFSQMNGWGEIMLIDCSKITNYPIAIKWENGNECYYRSCDIDETQIIKKGETINLTGTLTGQITPCLKEKPVITKMQKLTNKLRRFFNESQKLQYKAGYIDECNNSTENGRETLEYILREKFEAELNEAAKIDIAENEKK